MAKAKGRKKVAAKKPSKPVKPVKPVIKKPPAKKTPAKKKPPTSTGSWRAALGIELSPIGDDFATYLRDVTVGDAWEFADSPELAGLEAWGAKLAKRSLLLAVGAFAKAARHGFEIATTRAGAAAKNMGMFASEPSMDGASTEAQIGIALVWADQPDGANRAAAKKAFDATRQLNVWDDDLRPTSDDGNWYWYAEVGQCLLRAVFVSGGDPDGDSYDDWDAPTAIGRGLVIAALGLRQGRDSAAAVNELYVGMRS